MATKHKSLDELKRMSKGEIIDYFEEVGYSRNKLISLLTDIGLKSQTSSRKDMVQFVAGEVSSFGIFERLSKRRT